jgi:hypothetical protein
MLANFVPGPADPIGEFGVSEGLGAWVLGVGVEFDPNFGGGHEKGNLIPVQVLFFIGQFGPSHEVLVHHIPGLHEMTGGSIFLAIVMVIGEIGIARIATGQNGQNNDGQTSAKHKPSPLIPISAVTGLKGFLVHTEKILNINFY